MRLPLIPITLFLIIPSISHSQITVDKFPIPLPPSILPYIGGGLDHDGTYLWLTTTHPDSKVYKIDPLDGSVKDSYSQTHFSPGVSNVNALAYDRINEVIYNYLYPSGPFYLTDASTLQEVPGSTFDAPAEWVHDIAFDSVNRILWIVTGDAIHSNFRIYKVDAATKSVIGSFPTPANAPNPLGLAFDGKYLWVSEGSNRTLYQIDPDKALETGSCNLAINRKIYLPELNVPSGRLAWDGRNIWTSDSTYLYRINLDTIDNDILVFGYFPYYRVSSLEQMNYDYFTHLVAAFGKVDSSSVEGPYPYLNVSDLTEGDFTGKFVNKVKKEKGKVALLSIGGAGNGIEFVKIMGLKNGPKILAESIANYAYDNEYDGVDIDWEGHFDRKVFANFLSVLRGKLDKKFGKGKGTLAVAVEGSRLEEYDLKAMRNLVDYLLLMGYDYNYNELPGASLSSWAITKGYLEAIAAGGYPRERTILLMPYYYYYCRNGDGLQTRIWNEVAADKDLLASILGTEMDETYLEKGIYEFCNGQDRLVWVNDPYSIWGKTIRALFNGEIGTGNIGGVGAWELGQDYWDEGGRYSLSKAMNNAVMANIPRIRPDLTGQWVSGGQSCKTSKGGLKCKVTGSLNLRNIGNRDAGLFKVRFYISSNELVDEEDGAPLDEASVKSLKGGKEKTIRVNQSLAVGESASGKYLLAVIDEDGSVTEMDETNNRIILGPLQ